MSGKKIRFLPPRGASERERDFAINELIKAVNEPLPEKLTDIAALAATDGNIIVGNGTTWIAESGAVAQKSLGVREVLTANRTYYVRTDGNDSNDGLANTSGGAFLTLAKATSVCASIDCGAYSVTISVGAGTFAENVSLPAMLGSGTYTLSGAGVASTTIRRISSGAYSVWDIGGFKLAPSSGSALYIGAFGRIKSVAAIEFGAATGAAHIECAFSSTFIALADYTISGGAAFHWRADNGNCTIYTFGRTITLTGTPAFSFAFAYSVYTGTLIVGSMTFSGSATGQRFYVGLNSLIATNGGGASYLPGDATGTTDTASGGIYT